ncbi:MAG: amidohydrolase [Desulfobacterales bacterium]
MQKWDMVIRNGIVLTMDKQDTIVDKGLVGITGDRIAAVEKDVAGFEAKTVINASGGIILPGLINGHTHAAMSLFRGLADDLPLMDWLNRYIFPAEKRIDSGFVYTGTLLACAEMVLSGTTTFCDMYLFEEETARAAEKAGMRCLAGEVLYDFSSPNYGSIENGLAYAERMIEKWAGHPLISAAVEPHSIYTCSPDVLVLTNKLAVKHGVPLILHMSETRDEIVNCREKYGKSPFAYLKSLGILGGHVIADHCVWVDDLEIGIMADCGVSTIHSPESNMKLAAGTAPIPKLLDAGVSVGLGTDGCASNNNLDMFSEMDTAAKLHKVMTLDPTVMDARTVLKTATIGGAEALGMADCIGSIEIGKKADIIVVDTRKPHLTPMYNPYSHLVYAAKGTDVSHTIINGRLVMAGGKVMTLDVEDVMARARCIATRTADSLEKNR